MNWPVIHRRKSNQEISTEKLGKNGEKKELVHRTLIFGIKSLMNHSHPSIYDIRWLIFALFIASSKHFSNNDLDDLNLGSDS